MLGSRRKNSHQLADPQSLTSTAVPTEQMIRGRPPSELNAELALSISDLFRARLQLSLSFSLGSPNTCRHRASREASCSNCRTCGSQRFSRRLALNGAPIIRRIPHDLKNSHSRTASFSERLPGI